MVNISVAWFPVWRERANMNNQTAPHLVEQPRRTRVEDRDAAYRRGKQTAKLPSLVSHTHCI
jgi:hypothetical protein